MSGGIRPRGPGKRRNAIAAALVNLGMRDAGEEYRPQPKKYAGTPSTMAKDPQTGEAINPARRERRRIEAQFLERNGRRMNAKDWKREKRKALAGLPSALDVKAMVPGAK